MSLRYVSIVSDVTLHKSTSELATMQLKSHIRSGTWCNQKKMQMQTPKNVLRYHMKFMYTGTEKNGINNLDWTI